MVGSGIKQSGSEGIITSSCSMLARSAFEIHDGGDLHESKQKHPHCLSDPFFSMLTHNQISRVVDASGGNFYKMPHTKTKNS